MIFKETLHPEIVLGRKDPEYAEDLFNGELYKRIHDHLSFEDGVGWKVESDERTSFLFEDKYLVQLYVITKMFKEAKAKTYRLGKQFGETLFSVKNDIPTNLLPDNFLGYISVPKGVLVGDDDAMVRGAYVYVGDAKYTTADPSYWGTKMIWICAVETYDGLPAHGVSSTMIKCEENFDLSFKSLHISDIYVATEKTESTKSRLHTARSFVNSVLYISSLEPDIQHLKPFDRRSKKERQEETKAGRHLNLCTIPVEAINWGYQREYSVAETWRREHLRWQPCGPKRSEVKLIKVKGHKVTYKSHDEA